MDSPASSVRVLKPIFSTTLEMPPCCLDFCPLAPEYFVVGTYKLLENKPESSEDASQERTAQKESESISIGVDTRDFALDGNDSNTSQSSSEALPQQRIGSLYLFKILGNPGDPITLEARQTIPFTSGILDLSFSNRSPEVLGIVTSDGTIHLYHFNYSRCQLSQLHSLQAFSKNTLLLSLSWMHHSSADHGDRDCPRDCLATSDSMGDITLHYFSFPDYRYQARDRFPPTAKHSDQAWCVAWNTDPASAMRPMLISGGDDMVLNRHKLLNCIYPDGTPFAKYVSTDSDRKSHMAGVTAVMAFPRYEDEKRQLLLTGSYDDNVRIYDLGARRPALFELNLGGGVWKFRLIKDLPPRTALDGNERENGKSFPGTWDQAWGRARDIGSEMEKLDLSDFTSHKDDNPAEDLHFVVLVSCMYAGNRVISVSRDTLSKEWKIDVLGTFEEGESMAYAGSPQPLISRLSQRGPPKTYALKEDERQLQNGHGTLCVSTSFYDRKLFVWEWN